MLDHKESLRIREIDQKSGLVKAYFTYTTTDEYPRTGSCTLWFDLGKDWLLTRRVWEANYVADASDKTYERFEVTESKEFDGVWMPVRFTDVTWGSGRGLETPNGNLWETTAEDIKIGHVRRKTWMWFSLRALWCADDITGERWTVGKAGERLPYDDVVH